MSLKCFVAVFVSALYAALIFMTSTLICYQEKPFNIRLIMKYPSLDPLWENLAIAKQDYGLKIFIPIAGSNSVQIKPI